MTALVSFSEPGKVPPDHRRRRPRTSRRPACPRRENRAPCGERGPRRCSVLPPAGRRRHCALTRAEPPPRRRRRQRANVCAECGGSAERRAGQRLSAASWRYTPSGGGPASSTGRQRGCVGGRAAPKWDYFVGVVRRMLPARGRHEAAVEAAALRGCCLGLASWLLVLKKNSFRVSSRVTEQMGRSAPCMRMFNALQYSDRRFS